MAALSLTSAQHRGCSLARWNAAAAETICSHTTLRFVLVFHPASRSARQPMQQILEGVLPELAGLQLQSWTRLWASRPRRNPHPLSHMHGGLVQAQQAAQTAQRGHSGQIRRRGRRRR
jgi:hypothetical protein